MVLYLTLIPYILCTHTIFEPPREGNNWLQMTCVNITETLTHYRIHFYILPTKVHLLYFLNSTWCMMRGLPVSRRGRVVISHSVICMHASVIIYGHHSCISLWKICFIFQVWHRPWLMVTGHWNVNVTTLSWFTTVKFDDNMVWFLYRCVCVFSMCKNMEPKEPVFQTKD